MTHYQSDIPLWLIKGKTILVRADLNVPRKPDGIISDNFRLLKSLPTLELIKSKGGTSILLTHCGRPKNQEGNLSTKIFVSWFKEHGFNPIFCKTFEELHRAINAKKHNLIIFENLRFFEGEMQNSSEFAQKLFECGDYFIQDAAATLHREHASMVALPKLFDTHKKTIGLLVEEELIVLKNLLINTDKPFLLILGGNKIETKLPLIDSLLDTVDAILLCPALVFTFLRAQNKQVGNSLVNEAHIDHAKKLLEKAKEKNVDIIFPIDYQVTSNNFEHPFPLHVAQYIAPKMTGISIGPETAKLFKHCIMQANSLFFNGISGNETYPETLEGIKNIFNTLQQTAAKKIITGGDSIALARSLGYSKDMGIFLTGGGSTLTYLSGGSLPGLSALR
jgi:phosphoglycerate kinase